MISKKLIADIRALQLVKNRKDRNLFIAEGEKVVQELMESDIDIRFLAALPGFREKIPARHKNIGRYSYIESIQCFGYNIMFHNLDTKVLFYS